MRTGLDYLLNAVGDVLIIAYVAQFFIWIDRRKRGDE